MSASRHSWLIHLLRSRAPEELSRLLPRFTGPERELLERALRCTDPVVFAEQVLGIEPWVRQAEILRAVPQHPRIAVRSGHKVSKSNSAAILALWWVSTKRDSRVVITAPTGRQVRSILWRELTKVYQRARRPIGGRLSASPEQGLKFPDGREIVGFSTDEPERIAGWSGPSMLFIIDEASGVNESIFDAIEGNRAGGNAHVILFGNPTQTVGTFYEAFTSARELWHTLHISSEEAAEYQERVRRVPGLASRGWIEEKRAEWFPGARWDVRVRGNFPQSGDDVVIGLGLVEEAIARWHRTPEEGLLELGVDVARFGDDETVIQPRRGLKALPAVVLRSLDGPNVAGKVLEVVRQLRHPAERPRVKVDVIGYGASAFDCLVRSEEVEAMAINVGEAATVASEDGQPEYGLLRDQLWFGVQQWLRAGGAIPRDSKLEAELVAAHYGFTATGAVKVEPKEKIKERLKRSPDRADALCLAVYTPPQAFVGRFESDWMSR
jgi:phage terminase large subunit